MKIYAINIEPLMEEKLFERAYVTVGKLRKKKVDSCKMEADKMKSLGAGLLLAYSVSKAFNEPWSKLKEMAVMEYGEHGKPCFQEWKGISFNLSHSGNYAVCAVSVGENPYAYNKGNDVGIDVQKIIPCNLKVAKRVFLKEEYERLEKIALKDEKEASRFFTRLWTEKESRGKCTGIGVFLPEKAEGKLYIKNYTIGGEYVISVAGTKQELPEGICEVMVEKVLEVLE